MIWINAKFQRPQNPTVKTNVAKSSGVIQSTVTLKPASTSILVINKEEKQKLKHFLMQYCQQQQKVHEGLCLVPNSQIFNLSERLEISAGMPQHAQEP